MRKMLDICSGQWGWSNGFAARDWFCVGIDLVEPKEIPKNCRFICGDIRIPGFVEDVIKHFHFDFGCASSPCEEFSLFGLLNFHPNPPFPKLGIELFNRARQLLFDASIPHVLENVKSAQQFVGRAVHHAGPFYLWGDSVPPLLPHGFKKGISIGSGSKLKGMTPEEKRLYRKQFPALQCFGVGEKRKAMTAQWATIPIELSSCVAEYAERILEQRAAM